MGPLEGPRAIGGGPLQGSKPLRVIYLDEAGISAGEPVAVVAGLIVEADRDWMKADKLLRGVINECVPEHFRKDFIFHAKSIWSDKKYRHGWDMADRMKLIHSVLSIARVLEIPVGVGCARKALGGVPHLKGKALDEGAHMAAFAGFVGTVDAFIVDHCRPEEVGWLTAGDNTEMRDKLKRLFRALTENASISATQLFGKAGAIDPEQSPIRRFLGASRIADTVHFVDTRSAPLLQIADACAFAWRRYLAEQDWGEDLIESLLGYIPDKGMMEGSWPSAVFWPNGISATERGGPIGTKRRSLGKFWRDLRALFAALRVATCPV